jgi:hypothetical protein
MTTRSSTAKEALKPDGESGSPKVKLRSDVEEFSLYVSLINSEIPGWSAAHRFKPAVMGSSEAGNSTLKTCCVAGAVATGARAQAETTKIKRIRKYLFKRSDLFTSALSKPAYFRLDLPGETVRQTYQNCLQ